tara:strand:+ start:2433 stop:4310 length:1878 start_codon:yes stop_codon:yes gene_type:complete
MTSEQIQRIYNNRMRAVLTKNARIKKAEDDADRLTWQKKQEASAKLAAQLQQANLLKDLHEWRQSKLIDKTFEGDTGSAGVLPKKYRFKDERPIGEIIKPKNWLENVKRLTPKGALEERGEYKEFKAEEKALKMLEEKRSRIPEDIDEFTTQEPIEPVEAMDAADHVERLSWKADEARPEVPLAEELAVDEPIEADQHVFTDDPPLLDMPSLNESAKRSLYDRYYQDQASSGLSGMPKLSYEKWLEGVETGVLSGNYAEDASVHMGLGRYKKLSVPPAQPDVPLDVEDEFYTPTEEVIETDDLPSPAPQLDYDKIQGAAEDQKLQALRELETTPGVTPEVSVDPDLEKALGDLEKLKAPKVKGADKVLPEQLRASVGMSDMPDVEAPVVSDVGAQDVEISDAKAGFLGKTFNKLQTGQQIYNIGKTLSNEEASDGEKALAGTQGAKLLADLAAKHAGQKTVSQIGSQAVSGFLESAKGVDELGRTVGLKGAYKGLGKETLKLTGKQAVGTALGGAVGGYTMVTEAKEAGEAWKEKDYDEAILHGIGSVSGGLQTAGAGMMLTGVGAPLGAILFGVGTAASVISSGALFLEGLFGSDNAPAQQVAQVPKFDTSRYLESLRRQRRYN